MDVRSYFEARLNGRAWTMEEYMVDNEEFFTANEQLVNEISWKTEGSITSVVGFGSGKGQYEIRLANLIHRGYRLFDKRLQLWTDITPEWIRESFPVEDGRLFILANFVHVLKNPIAILEALPEGVQVVIIDTFMAKPNTEWQLFFDNYMREINGTRLPKMAQYESLPGWRLIAQYQNRRYLELGYVIIKKEVK